MKTKALLFVFLVMVSLAFSQNSDSTWFIMPHQWDGYDKEISFIRLDQESNMILAGKGEPDFGSDIKAKTQAYNVVYVLNMTENQELNWITYGTSLNNHDADVKDLKIDQEGNIHILGEFSGDIQFGDYTLIQHGGEKFYARLNSNGEVLFAGKVYDSYNSSTDLDLMQILSGDKLLFVDLSYETLYFTDDELLLINEIELEGKLNLRSVHPDKNDNIYLFGDYYDSLYCGQDTLFAEDDNCFLAKLNPQGEFMKTIGLASPHSFSYSMTTNSDGYSLIQGQFDEYIVFDQDTIHEEDHGSRFFAMFDHDLNLQWLKSSSIISYPVKSYENQFLFKYSTLGIPEFDGIQYDYDNSLYLFNLDVSGEMNWVKANGGNISGGLYLEDFTISENAYYLTGEFTGLVIFENTPYYSSDQVKFISKINDNSWTTGTAEIRDDQEELRVFPNPANNLISLKGLKKGKKYQLDIYLVNGQKIKTFEVLNQDQAFTIESLNPGIYFLKAMNSEHCFHTSFIKTK